MGKAKVVFRSRLYILCEGEGDDKDVAEAFLQEVVHRRTLAQDSFVRCESGGGFDAMEVVAITTSGTEVVISDKQKETT